MNTRKHLLPIIAACGALLASAPACGDSTPKASTAKPTITIVTYSSYLVDPRVKASVEKELGITLKIRAKGDGAEALSAAILTAGRPEGDIFFGLDNSMLSRAVAGKVFDKLDTAHLTNLGGIPKDLELDRSGQMVPIDVGPVCVDYDKTWFDTHQMTPPATLDDLADAKYKDLLVVESPVTSSTGLVFLMGTHTRFGDGTDDYWKRLKANGMSVAGSWDDAWGSQYTVSGGNRPLVLSYASSPPAEVFYSEGKVTTPSTGVVESSCVDQIEFAALLKGGAHAPLATKVLDAMLGKSWQEALPLSNFVYPARTDATLPPLFSKFAERPAASIKLDTTAINAHRDAWIDEWRKAVE